MRPLLHFILLFLAAGCAVVEIHGDARVEKSAHFGIISLKVVPEGKIAYVKTTALGPILGGAHYSLGFFSEQLVSIAHPEECSAIFIVESSAHLSNLLQFLKESEVQVDHLCATSMEGSQ